MRVDPGDRNVAGLQRTKAEVPNEAAVHSDNLYFSKKNPGRFTPRNAAGSQRQHSKKSWQNYTQERGRFAETRQQKTQAHLESGTRQVCRG